MLADRLEPEVVLEVDTYWAYAGGADVPALLARLGDRVVALHIKDGDGSLDPSKQVPVGSGVLPGGTSSRRLQKRSASWNWMTRKSTRWRPYASREFLLTDRV